MSNMLINTSAVSTGLDAETTPVMQSLSGEVGLFAMLMADVTQQQPSSSIGLPIATEGGRVKEANPIPIADVNATAVNPAVTPETRVADLFASPLTPLLAHDDYSWDASLDAQVMSMAAVASVTSTVAREIGIQPVLLSQDSLAQMEVLSQLMQF